VAVSATLEAHMARTTLLVAASSLMLGIVPAVAHAAGAGGVAGAGGATGGAGGVVVSGGSGGTMAASGGSEPGTGLGGRTGSPRDAGCSCRAASTGDAAAEALWLAAIAGAWLVRRRR
jgi:MYXO-CTERM domain-containing protein